MNIGLYLYRQLSVLAVRSINMKTAVYLFYTQPILVVINLYTYCLSTLKYVLTTEGILMKLLSITLIATSGLLLSACFEAPSPATTWYVDADGDGYGDKNDAGTASTNQPTGYVSNNTDCDDAQFEANPGLSEILYDGVDNDCSGVEFGNNEGYYSVGQIGPAGGIVFLITGAGDGREGLETAPEDLDDGTGYAEWGCYNATIAGADDTIIGAGAQNTADMVTANCSVHNSGYSVAIDLLGTYSLNGYSDWFIPSKDELNELYLQQGVVSGLSSTRYWSSSEESGTNYAWTQYFSDGLQIGNAKANLLRVRVVRTFNP